MENIQTCLDFLEYYGVSLNGVPADGKKQMSLSFRPLIIFFPLFSLTMWITDLRP